MSIVVSIRVKREIVELANEMVKYGLASNRNDAFNKLILKGLDEVKRELSRRKRVLENLRSFEKEGGIVLEKTTNVVEELGRDRE